MSALASLASIGRPIVHSSLLKGLTSEFMPYSYSLVPGAMLLLSAAAIFTRVNKGTTLSGKAIRMAAGLGTAALGALNVGYFLLQANCLGNELKECYHQGCTSRVLGDKLTHMYDERPPGFVESKCGL